MARPRSEPPERPRRRVPSAQPPEAVPPDDVQIHVRTLGACALHAGPAVLLPSADTMFALLLRLVHSPGMQVPRDVVVRELWPDQHVVRQRGNLRQTLYKLRRLGVRAGLEGRQVILDATQVVRTFAVERTPERFERDITQGNEPFGPFLPGYVPPWPELRLWLEQVRDEVHADLRRILVAQLRARRERADWTGVDVMARRLLAFDPLNEDATLAHAECLALAGSKAEAIALLDRYIAELGPNATDVRLPATMLRRRIAEPSGRGRVSFAPTERHFVGREEELAELTLAMRRARWHDGSGVLLHGPPGIGKTRLTVELAKVAQLEGMTVVRVECRESDAHNPFYLAMDLIFELLNQPGALGCTPDSMRCLRDLLPEPRQSTLNPVAHHEEATNRPAYPPRAGSIRQAVVELASAVSEERPVLVVVEDAHWMDAHSWDLLAELTSRTDALRLFILVTARGPHPCTQRPERTWTRLTAMPLSALSNSNAISLAHAIAADLSAPLDAELAEWFSRASEGVPLFLRSLVNHWIETGVAGGVPPTLASVIDQRLAGLSETSLTVLQSITLLGPLASVRTVSGVLELSRVATITALDALEKANAISFEASGRVSYHDLIGQASVRTMGQAARHALHHAIAVHLSRSQGETPQLSIATQALAHWEAAGDVDGLASAVLSASDLLLASGAAATLLSVLQRLDRSYLDHTTAKHLLAIQTRAEVQCGVHREGLLPRLAPGISDRPLDDSEAASILAALEATYRSDPTADRTSILDRCCQLAGRAEVSDSQRLHAADLAVRIASNYCDLTTANSAYAAVADIVLSDSADLSDVLPLLAAFHTMFGDMATGSTAAHDLLALGTGPSQTALYHRCVRAGYALRLAGETSDAITAFAEAVAIASGGGFSDLLHYPLWQLSAIALEAGDLSTASTWRDRLRTAFLQRPTSSTAHFVHLHNTRLDLELGNAQEAANSLRLAEQSLRHFPTPKTLAYQSALQLAVALPRSCDEPIDEALLETALARHAATARFGTSDFISSVCAEAIALRDGVPAALSFLNTYLCSLRRERGKVSERLQRTKRALEAALID